MLTAIGYHCHCEERSDVAIRILKTCRFALSFVKIRIFRGTDCHTSVSTGSQ